MSYLGSKPGSSLYAEITVPSAELLTIGDTPVTLIPSPGPGKFIQVIDVTLILDFVSVAYNITDAEILMGGVIAAGPGNLSTFLNSDTDALALIYPPGQNTIFDALPFLNQSLTLTGNSGNPSQGDNDLVIKISYRIVSTDL